MTQFCANEPSGLNKLYGSIKKALLESSKALVGKNNKCLIFLLQIFPLQQSVLVAALY